MRAIASATALAFLGGAAFAQAPEPAAPTVSEVLACEADAAPAACLLRAGARGLDSERASGDIFAAAERLGLDESDLALGPDTDGLYAALRAVAEARRLDAAGAAPEAALAPIAALPAAPDGEPRGDQIEGYRLFAGDHYSERLAPSQPSEASLKLALSRLEDSIRADEEELLAWPHQSSDDEWRAVAREDAKADIALLSRLYGKLGLIDDGRALLERWDAGDHMWTEPFWIDAKNFAAAERAGMMDAIDLALVASEAGDHATAIRVGREGYDRALSLEEGGIIVSDSPDGVAVGYAEILIAAGETEEALTVAGEREASGYVSDAVTIHRLLGDEDGACAAAQRMAAAAPEPTNDDERSAARYFSMEAALALYGCGLRDEAIATLERGGVSPPEGMTADGTPSVFIALSDPSSGFDAYRVARLDIDAGRFDRAADLAEALLPVRPGLAYNLAEDAQDAGNSELTARLRGAVFGALGTELSALPLALAPDDPLTDGAREAVFRTAFWLTAEATR